MITEFLRQRDIIDQDGLPPAQEKLKHKASVTSNTVERICVVWKAGVDRCLCVLHACNVCVYALSLVSSRGLSLSLSPSLGEIVGR